MLIATAAAFLLAVLVPHGHRWLIVAGAVAAIAWWLVGLAGDDDDVSETFSPLLGLLLFAMVFVVWCTGVAAGWVVRRALSRSR